MDNNSGTVRINTEVLATQMNALSLQVNKLESKLDAYATHFVTAEVYELKHRELELQLNSIKIQQEAFQKETDHKIEVANKDRTLKAWTLGTGSAIAGAILTFLIIFYLQHN